MRIVKGVQSGVEPKLTEYRIGLDEVIVRNNVVVNEYQHTDRIRVVYTYDETIYTTDEYCLLKINECGGSAGPSVDPSELDAIKKDIVAIKKEISKISGIESMIQNIQTEISKIAGLETSVSKIPVIESEVAKISTIDASLSIVLTDISQLKNKDIELEERISQITPAP